MNLNNFISRQIGTINVCACCSISQELFNEFRQKNISITSIISGSLPLPLNNYVHDDRLLFVDDIAESLNVKDLNPASISEWFKYFLLAAKREVIYCGHTDASLYEYFQYLVYSIINIYICRNISIVVFGSIPHRVISISAFVAAKIVNIKTTFNYHNALIHERNLLKSRFAGSFVCSELNDIVSVPTRFFSQSSYRLNSDEIKSLSNKSHNFNRGLKAKSFLSGRLFVSFLSQLFTKRNLTYGYYNVFHRFFAIVGLLTEYNSYLMGRRFYYRNSIKSCPKHPYIVLFLNRRPEANHSPHSGPYIDDLRILQILVEATTTLSCDIIVKEHPNTFRLGFNPGSLVSIPRYLNMLSISSRVKLFHPSVLDPHFSSECIAVASSSQSAGLEACLANKKTIVFGYVWWTKVMNSHAFTDISSLEKYINSSNYSDLPSIPSGSFPNKDFRALSLSDYASIISDHILSLYSH